MRIAVKRDPAQCAEIRLCGQVKSMDCIEEEERAHTFIEIRAAMTKLLEFIAFGKKLVNGRGAAEGIEREVALGLIGAGDDLGELAHATRPVFRVPPAIPRVVKGFPRGRRPPSPARAAR